MEAGLTAHQASARARILYWAYLGHGISATRPAPAEWRRIRDELVGLAAARKSG
jgi:hypothetical protein